MLRITDQEDTEVISKVNTSVPAEAAVN